MLDQSRNRNAALAGWRGIAILLVLADHWQSQWLGHYAPYLPQTGQHGVTLFFVLSGYLITTNLLNIESLKNFYIRRFFRLMPAAWCYLAFLCLLGWMIPSKSMSLTELASCLFSFRNYITRETLLSAVHFWSLSVEEQFYYTWPVILLFAGRRRGLQLCSAAAVGIALFRFAFWSTYNNKWMSFHTEVRADALCVGCALALLLARPGMKAKLTVAADGLFLPALAVFAGCVCLFRWLPPLVESCAIAVLLLAAVVRPESWHSKLLALRPLAWLGTVSYSVYLWQEFFFNRLTPRYNLLLDCCMPVFALGSYYLIERPCTAFGKKLTRMKPVATESAFDIA